jgi:hypothetical protein
MGPRKLPVPPRTVIKIIVKDILTSMTLVATNSLKSTKSPPAKAASNPEKENATSLVKKAL